MALSHIDFTGHPHMACIHLMACLVDGRSYTLLACQRALHNCPHCCINGIQYRPNSSHTRMRMGSPSHVISTSSSLKTVTSVLVNMDMVPSLEVLPTLINDVRKTWKVSACRAHAESVWNGSRVTCFAWLVPILATPTLRVDCHRMGRPALAQSLSLI